MTRQPDLSSDVQLDRDVCKLVHQLAQKLDVHVRRVAEELGSTATQVVALRELSEPITARELADQDVLRTLERDVRPRTGSNSRA